MFFEYPKLLYLALIIPLMILLYVWREIKGRQPYLTVSNISPWNFKKENLLKRILLSILKGARASGSKVVMRGVNDDIKNVFQLTGLIDLFDFE